jgi:hypothetical protein
MKILLYTLSLVGMISTSAMASTARVNTLLGGSHVVDAITMFEEPSDMHKLPEIALIEYGYSNAFVTSQTAGTTVPQAQGGFLKSFDTAKFGFFLGAGTTGRSNVTSGAAGKDFEAVENPFTVFYGSKAGDMGWGVSFMQSSSTKKTGINAVTGEAAIDTATQSKMRLVGSVDMGNWIAGAKLGLADTAKTKYATGAVEANYTGTETTLFGKYTLDTSLIGLSYAMTGTKVDTNFTGTKVATDDSNGDLTLSYVNEIKKEGANFYYGAAYVMGNQTTKVGTAETKVTTQNLPVYLGVEADAASWLVLRGSVIQTVLLGSVTSKATGAASLTDSNEHDTKVAAGMGFKFNKSILDMSLTAATNGNVASNALGASAAYTYMF